jgi:hypothetical protein
VNNTMQAEDRCDQHHCMHESQFNQHRHRDSDRDRYETEAKTETDTYTETESETYIAIVWLIT